MIHIAIPDYGDLEIKHVVSDYNGTLAVDGVLIEGVAEALRALSRQVEIHVITADTFGVVRAQLSGLPVTLTITPNQNQAETKLAYVQKLGEAGVVAIGNGRNDRKMLAAAAIGIALIQKEGGATEAFFGSDIVSRDILEALDLLQNTKRLKASLRS